MPYYKNKIEILKSLTFQKVFMNLIYKWSTFLLIWYEMFVIDALQEMFGVYTFGALGASNS